MSNFNINNDEIINYLVSSDIINLGDVREQISLMYLEKQIMENHHHKIWQGKNGRWYTYIYDDTMFKNRRLIAKSSKQSLLKFLSGRLDILEHEEVTIRSLYPKWREHKLLMTEESSVMRVDTDWKRYYINDPIVDIPLKNFNKVMLEDWIMHLIRDNKMTKTKYYNSSLIIRQIFQYAFDMELIERNPFERVKKDLGRFFVRVNKPDDETQVYTNEEISLIESLITEDMLNDGKKVYRLTPLAILFQFYTGLRVGEICALKYTDVLNNGKLRVQRIVVRDTKEVRERTKGALGSRDIYITTKAKKIIESTISYKDKIKMEQNDYIFSLNSNPLPERWVNEYLKRYCKTLNIPYRSSHKLRKTAISSMVNSGMSLNAVRAFAGHMDERTTLNSYTFDRNKEDERKKQIEKALSYE